MLFRSVSHHGCVTETVKAGQESEIISAAYASDCRGLLEHVDLWIYGHTHESRDFRIGHTRVVSNAKGYSHDDNPQFDKKCVIEI